MIAIVGIGNKGKKYDNTRHNIGFALLDKLADQLHCPAWKKADFLHSETTRANKDILLIKPTTYVNESGQALKAIVEKKDVSLKNIWIIHDEVELPLGQIRVKKGGSSAGHNGIKSIDDAIGRNYWRIRVGVGKNLTGAQPLADYVLGHFEPSEQPLVATVIDQTTQLLVKFIKEGIETITINAEKENH